MFDHTNPSANLPLTATYLTQPLALKLDLVPRWPFPSFLAPWLSSRKSNSFLATGSLNRTITLSKLTDFSGFVCTWKHLWGIKPNRKGAVWDVLVQKCYCISLKKDCQNSRLWLCWQILWLRCDSWWFLHHSFHFHWWSHICWGLYQNTSHFLYLESRIWRQGHLQ